MLILLESKAAINAAQRKLEATLRREFPRRVVRDISHPGGTNKDAHVHTDGAYWFWSDARDAADHPNPRQLNWFGRYEANDRYDLRITVEANTPFEGRNDQISGFFARDSESDKTYLLHSGRIGGGAKGVGKETFLAWRNEPLHKVVDETGEARFGVLVMPVEGRGAARSATRYIDLVARFKDAVKAGQIGTQRVRKQQHDLKDFFSESHGRRKGRRSSMVDYVSRHGEIVDALHQWRVARGLPAGAKVVKNLLLDMGVKVDGKLREVYEVKTRGGRDDAYAAIGQVLVHADNTSCRRIVVFPHDEELPEDIAAALNRLGIDVLKCKLSPNAVAIAA